MLLVWAQNAFKLAQRDWFEFCVAAAMVAFGSDFSPASGIVVLKIYAVKRIERSLHIRRIDRPHAEPSCRRAVLRGGAVAEHVVHRFDCRDVEQGDIAVFQEVAVAAIDGSLDFGGRHIFTERIKRASYIESSVGSIFNCHDWDHRGHITR